MSKLAQNNSINELVTFSPGYTATHHPPPIYKETRVTNNTKDERKSFSRDSEDEKNQRNF